MGALSGVVIGETSKGLDWRTALNINSYTTGATSYNALTLMSNLQQ